MKKISLTMSLFYALTLIALALPNLASARDKHDHESERFGNKHEGNNFQNENRHNNDNNEGDENNNEGNSSPVSAPEPATLRTPPDKTTTKAIRVTVSIRSRAT